MSAPPTPLHVLRANRTRLAAELAVQTRQGMTSLASLTRQYLAQVESELARRAEAEAQQGAAS